MTSESQSVHLTHDYILHYRQGDKERYYGWITDSDGNHAVASGRLGSHRTFKGLLEAANLALCDVMPDLFVVGTETPLVIPFESVQADALARPESVQLGAIAYWALDSAADDSICLARIRGILKSFDEAADLERKARLTRIAARAIESAQ